jgi:hypothetical protein
MHAVVSWDLVRAPGCAPAPQGALAATDGPVALVRALTALCLTTRDPRRGCGAKHRMRCKPAARPDERR